jgi:hypothetical protein
LISRNTEELQDNKFNVHGMTLLCASHSIIDHVSKYVSSNNWIRGPLQQSITHALIEPQSHERFHIFCEPKLRLEMTGITVRGNVEYMIGLVSKDEPPKRHQVGFWITIEATV